ncbi:hypothetical protein BTVI_60750 [Pitangus sulphuratus]|nr:hypothetical protein BTVI_60750 [Pitangus sulphuratus]
MIKGLMHVASGERLEIDHVTTSGGCSDADDKTTELTECTTKEVLYIPYNLATSYITKIIKDMQQMKNKHMKIIRKLDNISKENQEWTITTIKKHYGEKMRCLKSQLEDYQELMNKSNTYWQVIVKVWILENLCKTLDYLYTQHTLTLQELHNISLHVEKLHDLMNFQIKILQPKPEKAEGEKSDMSEVSLLKTEEITNEEEKTEWSMEKGYLWQGHTILQTIQESLQKRQKEVTELLQSERRFNKAMKPQMTMLVFLKSLVKKVHTIYRDVPGAQQCISQLIRKNDDERADRKEAFNKAQADILSYEVLHGNEPMDDTRRGKSQTGLKGIVFMQPGQTLAISGDITVALVSGSGLRNRAASSIPTTLGIELRLACGTLSASGRVWQWVHGLRLGYDLVPECLDDRTILEFSVALMKVRPPSSLGDTDHNPLNTAIQPILSAALCPLIQPALTDFAYEDVMGGKSFTEVQEDNNWCSSIIYLAIVPF